jgi:hypothetical protein
VPTLIKEITGKAPKIIDMHIPIQNANCCGIDAATSLAFMNASYLSGAPIQKPQELNAAMEQYTNCVPLNTLHGKRVVLANALKTEKLRKNAAAPRKSNKTAELFSLMISSVNEQNISSHAPKDLVTFLDKEKKSFAERKHTGYTNEEKRRIIKMYYLSGVLSGNEKFDILDIADNLNVTKPSLEKAIKELFRSKKAQGIDLSLAGF